MTHDLPQTSGKLNEEKEKKYPAFNVILIQNDVFPFILFFCLIERVDISTSIRRHQGRLKISHKFTLDYIMELI